MQTLQNILSNPLFIVVWACYTLLALFLLIKDLREKNNHLMPMMKVVWVLTILYSGLVGLIIYYYSGRKQIPKDNLFRKGFRSVSHCYSGCGAGEVAGIFIAAGLLNMSNWWVAGITFTLAFVFGFTVLS